MKYPNVRYGNPEHLAHYAAGWPLKKLAKHLRRDERTIRRWLSGESKVPWWVPEVLRLERYEKYHQMQQMRMNPVLAKVGVVHGQVLEFPNIHEVRARNEQRKQSSAKAVIKRHNDRLLINYK